MQICVHKCIIMQASAQECRRAWPGSSANIRRGNRESVAQLARIAAADTAQAGGIVCNGCVWPCVAGSSANVSSAAAASRSRTVGGVGCVDRLRKQAARRSAWLRWLVCCKNWRIACALVAYHPGAILASVAALVECVQDSKQDNTQEGKREHSTRTGPGE